jgi:hypothetical protein
MGSYVWSSYLGAVRYDAWDRAEWYGNGMDGDLHPYGCEDGGPVQENHKQGMGSLRP